MTADDAGPQPARSVGGRKPGPAAPRAQRAAVDDPETVLGAGLRFLEARPRSVAETRRRLIGAGYRPELVERAIERLVDLGLLDDAAFATAWVESRDRAHPRGEAALTRELRLKGVAPAVIETVLDTRRRAAAPGTSGADDSAAERLLARHAHSLARIADPRTRRSRAYSLLARHGFDADTASRLAARVAAPEEPA